MDILVLTRNKLLGQKLRLLLRGLGNITVADENKRTKIYDRVIVDLDTAEDTEAATLKLSSTKKEGALSIPFRHDELLERLTTRDTPRRPIEITKDGHWAILGDRRIRLTDAEARLLSELITARGYVSRELILKRVWGNLKDSGIVNVYIHYLREKLESNGEKIILSSRKFGYKIDDKYIGGAEC